MNAQLQERNRTSIRILLGIVLGLGLIVLLRLFQLQVLEYDTYGPLSFENSIREESVHPPRGLIYDRNGKLLTDNEPIYTITITPSKFDKSRIPMLALLLDVPEEEVSEKVKKAQQYSWQRSSRLFPEVTFEVFSRIQEHIWELPGINHVIESRRYYSDTLSASHILGYLRELTEKQYSEAKDKYRLGDKAGTTGIEKFYESTLRGELGTSFVRINAFGQALGVYDNGDLDIPPISGKNIHTTVDTELQRLAEVLMNNKIGGLVAMDPRDGAIRAMVSAPNYDLSRLSGKLDNEYWKQLNADTLKPLFNRAATAMQPPGSTFKPLVGLIGLKLGIITPQTSIYCNGAYYKGREYKCTARHGEQQLESAIQNSCNTYFFSLMNRIGSQVGLDIWARMVNDFGLGVRTGVDLPTEARGVIPDSSYFNRAFGKKRWGIGDVINLGVGQGAIGTTPLQLATYVSAVANGGYLVKPHFVEGVSTKLDDYEALPINRKKIDWVQAEHLQVIQAGMRRVVTSGSARGYANIKEVEISGKTGTAQNPHGFDHAWFVCYAPSKNPEIAIAVLVENGGFGASSALPIASLLMEQYFTGKVQRQWVFDRMMNFVPKEAKVRR